MASVSALFFKPGKTLEMLKFGSEERPYVVQLFGNKPEHFAKAARIISEFHSADSPPTEKLPGSGLSATRPDGIDINFGCPAKKVFGHGAGCALMPQTELAREIISAVCNNTDLPVSIKIRAGIKDINAIDFIESIKDLPFVAIMIHGRTYEGGFSGQIDFALIEKIKKIIPDKIVLANGGIHTPEDAKNILEKCPSIDGLGIARGAWGRPYIFDEIKSALATRRDGLQSVSTVYDFEQIKKIAIQHAELLWQNKGKMGILEIRKHMAWYFKGFTNASELRQKLVQAKSVEEIKSILNI